MGRRSKYTFPQWRHTDGYQVHEEMLNTANYSVQFSRSVMSDSLWPHESQHTRQGDLSITNCRSLLKPMSIESVMPSSHLILCRPLLLLPPIPPSVRVFSNESTLHMRWPKYWSFSFSISPSNDHPGLISFRMDWLDLLREMQVKRICKSICKCKSNEISSYTSQNGCHQKVYR